MKQKIYAVRDTKTAQYATPMFLINKGHAIRSLQDEVNRVHENNILNKHPGDFELMELGDYDTDTGIITPQTPTQVVTASELIKQTPNT